MPFNFFSLGVCEVITTVFNAHGIVKYTCLELSLSVARKILVSIPTHILVIGC